MAIAATTTAVGPPFAKLVELGDTLVGAYAGSKRRQRQNFETRQPIFKPDGKPSYEEVLHLVAMPGTTARIGTDGEHSTIEDGAHVRYSVDGFKWKQTIDGRKALPARAGFRAGQECSGDVYAFRLVGWSAETKNPDAATKAGFTVVDGRIVLRSQEDKDRYVLAQSRSGGNTNPAKDIEVEVRRPTDGEKRWEQAADELFLTKPWDAGGVEADAAAGGADGGLPPIDEEPFIDLGVHFDHRNLHLEL